jgi:hypothetical protein
VQMHSHLQKTKYKKLICFKMRLALMSSASFYIT